MTNIIYIYKILWPYFKKNNAITIILYYIPLPKRITLQQYEVRANALFSCTHQSHA